jgi:hypothetical protein
MVDKTWDPHSAQPFTTTEQLVSGVSTSITRAIYVRAYTNDGDIAALQFRDNAGPINVALQVGEIYPFGITSWTPVTYSGLPWTGDVPDIWGLW